MNLLSGLTRVIWNINTLSPLEYKASFDNRITINTHDISIIRTNEQNPYTSIIFKNGTLLEVKESYEDVLLLIKRADKSSETVFTNLKDEKVYKGKNPTLSGPGSYRCVDYLNNRIEYIAFDSFNRVLGYLLASDRLVAISKVKKLYPKATWFRPTTNSHGRDYGLYSIKDGKYVPTR